MISELDNEVQLFLQEKNIDPEELIEMLCSCSNMTSMDYRELKEAEGMLLSSGSDGLMFINGFVIDEDGEYFDSYDMTPPISLEKEGEFVKYAIHLAKNSLSARQELAQAIEATLAAENPVAPLYQKFIIDCVMGKIPPPKPNKPKKSEADYITLVRTAYEISEEYGLPLTRNDASPPHSALDVVSFITRKVPFNKSISYATLKKHGLEAYKKRPGHYY